MKNVIGIVTFFCIGISFASGNVEKKDDGLDTKKVCTSIKKEFCGHAHFYKYPTTSIENEFTLHVETNDPAARINNLKVILWMDMGGGHGHASAPVEINPSDEENHFLIQNAWFPMMGEWQIIVTINENNQTQTIKIPVKIDE